MYILPSKGAHLNSALKAGSSEEECAVSREGDVTHLRGQHPDGALADIQEHWQGAKCERKRV